jgi:hypothetical protein
MIYLVRQKDEPSSTNLKEFLIGSVDDLPSLPTTKT